MDVFPYSMVGDRLERKDFLRFSGLFTEIVATEIPGAGSIRFVENSAPFAKIFVDAMVIRKLSAAFAKMVAGELEMVVVADTIMFAFPLAPKGCIAAVVRDVDPLVLQGLVEDWLVETRAKIIKAFVEIKQQYQEPVTGLLNNAHLFSVLEHSEDPREKGLLLVALGLPRKVLSDVLRDVQRAAADLSLYSEECFFLYYLGESVFALLREDCGDIRLEQVSATLIQQLRKEGYARVQIGIGRWICYEEQDNCRQLLDSAWSALQTAKRRGPFSFCDYARLMDSAAHPLYVASAAMLRKLSHLARKDMVFSLAKLSAKATSDQISRLQNQVVADGVSLLVDDDGSVFCYLAQYTAKQALCYMAELVTQLGWLDASLYCGVCSFPYADFSRQKTIQNVQKVLLHAAFLGPQSVVLFDALSLNVSGDVYFADGDFATAVAEYKKGLLCAPDDCNLLNSLGVAYALLNRNALARKTFFRVLELDPENYMALYNLGLDARGRGAWHEAIRYFEQAESYCDESVEESVRRDMQLQLGILYCVVARFDEALKVLERWQNIISKERHGPVYRYLGEACLETGETGKAMMWLQKALQYHSFDAEAMSLLGCALLRAGEGDDIALTLCLKGVELAPHKPMLRYRLAEAQWRNGQYREALRSLKHCNGKAVAKEAVYLLRARIYAALHDAVRARGWAERALRLFSVDDPGYQEAQSLSQNREKRAENI